MRYGKRFYPQKYVEWSVSLARAPVAMNIFTYGSLMFSQVWGKVVLGNYFSSPAMLNGYKRYRIRNETYPGLFEGKAIDSVSGVLYHDISADDLVRLDAFEGDYYERVPEKVAYEDRLIPAQVYITKHQYLQSEDPWDPEYFRKYQLSNFLVEYG